MKYKTDAVTQYASRNLALRKDGPYRVLQLRQHTVTVDVNGVRNDVSIDRTTLGRAAIKARSAIEKKRQTDAQNNKINTSTDECVVKRIDRRNADDQGAKFPVRWYGYRPADSS